MFTKIKEIKKLPYFSKLIDREEAIELVLDAKSLFANAVNKLYKKKIYLMKYYIQRIQ